MEKHRPTQNLPREGDTVGSAVNLVGEPVVMGCTEGVLVGVLLGFAVGDATGAAEGDVNAELVGLVVCPCVGDGVGERIGERIGEGVGNISSTSQIPSINSEQKTSFMM